MKKRITIILLVVIACIIVSAITIIIYNNNYYYSCDDESLAEYMDYIYDAVTEDRGTDIVLGKLDNEQEVLEKAVEIMVQKFGKKVLKQKPHRILYVEKYDAWYITGTVRGKNVDGGTASTIIRKSDGKVIALWHGA